MSLVAALTAEFPDFAPYEGIHDEVVPHVTVAKRDDPELLARIRAEVEPRLRFTAVPERKRSSSAGQTSGGGRGRQSHSAR